jgi:hypothetical protein
MVSATDFITIPYTLDMTQGGIAYACKSLHYTYNRMRSSPFKRLQRIVAGVAIELAFRRYLSQNNIPHNNLGATPFTDPDRYDIAIEEAQALVPSDQIASTEMKDEDIYIFAFLTALLTPNQHTLEKAIQAEQPIYLIYPLPKDWARPQKWHSLGEISIKSNCTKSIKIELGGQNKEHTIQSEQVILKPLKKIKNQVEFFALHYLYTPNLPDGSIGIKCDTLDDLQIIEPFQWGNIWIYGMDCIFTGYITCKDFRRKAKHLPSGSRVFQYPRTSTDNLALPTKDLYPLKGYFDQAIAWKK